MSVASSTIVASITLLLRARASESPEKLVQSPKTLFLARFVHQGKMARG
jgi:hypothetical protein